MTSRHSLYIEEAISEAKKGNMRMLHGAIIVSGSTIVSRAHNSNEKYSHNNFSVHAEVAAIRNMIKNRINVVNATMYVVRIHSKDLDKEDAVTRTMNSKPCKACMRFISQYNLKKVFFTSGS